MDMIVEGSPSATTYMLERCDELVVAIDPAQYLDDAVDFRASDWRTGTFSGGTGALIRSWLDPQKRKPRTIAPLPKSRLSVDAELHVVNLYLPSAP
jgi:hypothetical protein